MNTEGDTTMQTEPITTPTKTRKPKPAPTTAVLELTIARRDLLRLTAQCQGVAAKTGTMPILSHLLLTTDGQMLRVSATDMYLGITCEADADVQVQGSVALNARDLHERIKAMPDGLLHFSVSESFGVTIKATGTPRRFTMRGLSHEDFPALTKPDADVLAFSIAAGALSDMLTRAAYAISTDETRPHINSLLVERKGDILRLVSTDGHRLAKTEMLCAGPSEGTLMLLPLRGVTELGRIAGGAGESEIRVLTNGTRAFFEVGTTRFVVKLADAVFPPYEQVIPKKSKHTVLVPRGALVDALAAVGVATDKKTNRVIVTVASGVMRLETDSASDEVMVVGDSDVEPIGLSVPYLLEALRAVDADEVTMRMLGSDDPVVIEADGYLAVVMPMRIER